MRRLLVVDDERPVVDAVSLIVKRELSGEFEVAGVASSGREAIEKAMAIAPDIVLMDVRMPGISGLDAIRELHKRGSGASFILMTAYERFDIARDAVELGVLDYLLKPVSKDKLAASLRAAAGFMERRGELERMEIEYREGEERARAFVETAFLHGIMLGERFGPELGRYRASLGMNEPFAQAIAVAFLPPQGSPDPDAEARSLHESFRATLRYKTDALAGPLVACHCFVLLPLKDEEAAPESTEAIKDLVARSYATELEKGRLRLGFGSPRPLEEASLSWAEALANLLGGRVPGARSKAEGPSALSERNPFEEDEAFLELIRDGSLDPALLALELILEPLGSLARVEAPDRFRMISLFGSAYRILAMRGQLDPALARELLNLEDLRAGGGGSEGASFSLAVRSRFSALVGVMTRMPRLSAPVGGAVAYIRENYCRQMTLESAADFVGISPNRLSRLFVEETGRGFSDYLIEFRIEKAKELLSMSGATIKQVSVTCGYSDPNYFSRLFKKVTGLTPTAFSSGAAEETNAEK